MAPDKKESCLSSVDDDIINIPDWLLWELLLRLPSKLVVRCKLVSKRWASLISDPLFVGSYVSRYSPSKQWTVITCRMTIENYDDVSLVEHELPKEMCYFGSLRLPPNNLLRGSETYKVFGASNDGLVLFGLVERLGGPCSKTYATFPDCYRNPNIYYLCNPATRELVSLPRLLQPATTVYFDRNWGPIGLVTRIENHSVLESFRVVLLLPPYPETDRGYLRLIVYASETLQWNEFILPCEIPARHITNLIPPATLNSQILHWVTKYGSIIAYDPYANPSHIRIIAPPDPRGDEPSMSMLDSTICDASGGKLRYFEKLAYKDDELAARFRLWVLEDYYGLAQWRLSHDASVRAGDDEEEERRPRMLKELGTMFFDPSDTDIIYLADSRGLVSYNVNTRKIKVVQDHVDSPLNPWELAVLVQVSPWPISII